MTKENNNAQATVVTDIITKNNKAKRVFELDFEADAFVVPNSASSLVDFYLDSTRDRLVELYDDISNNYELADIDHEYFVQMWFLNSKEQYGFTSENWNDHGLHARVNDNGVNKVLLLYPRLDRLPISLFNGKHEGDVIKFSTNCIGYAVGEDHKDQEIIICKMNIKMRLNQLDYRYRRFGRFEEVINYLRPVQMVYAEA